jgi:hypothetical protein
VEVHVTACARIFSSTGLRNAVNHLVVDSTVCAVRTVAGIPLPHGLLLKGHLLE